MSRKYRIENAELNNILTLLRRVFNIRITYYDLQERELSDFNIKGMSAYCETRRRRADFNAACVQCDTENLLLARKTRDVHAYRCHQGMLECVVPLYDKRDEYLGAIVFGQLREKGRPLPDNIPARYRKLYASHMEFSLEQVNDLGELLKYLSEYIIENELIKRESRPWAEKLEAYIENHLDENITLEKLGAAIHRSATFVSHYFRREFGLSPKRYVLRKKMETAMKALKDGETIAAIAEKLGFYDEFHFSKSFKTFWGQPPSRFKRT